MPDPTDLEKDELLAHYQAITGQHDLDECRGNLEAHGWNLDAAVHAALSHGEASSGHHFREHLHNSGAGDAPPPGPAPSEAGTRGWFHSLTGFPLWRVVSSAVRIATCKSRHITIRVPPAFPHDLSIPIKSPRDKHTYMACPKRGGEGGRLGAHLSRGSRTGIPVSRTGMTGRRATVLLPIFQSCLVHGSKGM